MNLDIIRGHLLENLIDNSIIFTEFSSDISE
jgi:hypothetical protein